MKQILLKILCCCLPLLAFAACSAAETMPEDAESADSMETMTVAAMPSLDKVPIIVGIDRGYFANHGLRLKLENFQSPTDRNAALQAGKVDGVMSDMVADVLYLAAGMDMKMTSLIQTDFAVIASADSGIMSFADITGEHTNGIALNCLMEYIADEAGPAEKIMVADVMTRVEQVLSGDLDLAVVPEPYGSMAVARGAVYVGSAGDLGIDAAVMLFPADYLAEHRVAVEAFYAGYQEAVDYLQINGIDDVLDSVLEIGEFSESAAEGLREAVYIPLTTPEEGQFEAIVRWMDQHPEFDGPYDDLDFSDITDFSFLEGQ